MTGKENSSADGPGEALIDEPTEPALDPEADPNTEWEEKAAEQISEGEGATSHEGSSDDAVSDDAGADQAGDSEESGP